MTRKKEGFLRRVQEAAVSAGAISACVEQFDDGSIGLAITRRPTAMRSQSHSMDDYINWVKEVA